MREGICTAALPRYVLTLDFFSSHSDRFHSHVTLMGNLQNPPTKLVLRSLAVSRPCSLGTPPVRGLRQKNGADANSSEGFENTIYGPLDDDKSLPIGPHDNIDLSSRLPLLIISRLVVLFRQ